jgi:hypothetical protein
MALGTALGKALGKALGTHASSVLFLLDSAFIERRCFATAQKFTYASEL